MTRIAAATAAIVLLFVTGCAHTRAECTAHGGTEWREVTTPHFTVRTNLDSSSAKEASLELERSRQSLLLAFQNKVDPPGRLDAIILRNHSELTEFASDNAAAFIETSRPAGPIIVLAGESGALDGSPERTPVVHELAHYLLSYAVVRQPSWFAEGMAAYLETTRPYGEDEVRIGEANYDLMYWVRSHARVPFEDLWKWTSIQARQAELISYYATSWAWVHFLINKHESKFREFQARLAQSQDPRQAWNDAFGTIPQAELEKELNIYLDQGTYSAFRFKQPELSQDVQERLLSNAEVHGLRAELAALSFDSRSKEEKKQRLDAEIAAALALDAHQALALELRARNAEKANRVELARALTVAHPERGVSWELLGLSLMEDPAAAQERRAALVKALELSPDSSSVLNSLAWDYAQTGQAKPALVLAAKAVRLAPWNPSIVDTWAVALAKNGRCREAVDAERRALELLHESGNDGMRKEFEQRAEEFQKPGCGAPPSAATSSP